MEFQYSQNQEEAFRKAVLTAKKTRLKHRQREYLSQRVSILNVDIDNFALEEFLKRLRRGIVFTPNVDHVMRLQKDIEFIAAYQQADFRVCDSQILMYAAKFLGTPLKSKISGSDFFPVFCHYHRNNEAIKIFLLGGAPGVPQRAQQNINDRSHRKIVVDAYAPSYGFEKDVAECQKILTRIRQSEANVLVVGVGSPKQEKWIASYRDQLPTIDIFMGVGAAIDFAAGHKSRSPQWLSNLGLEWGWRLLSEPQRLWKRYLLDDMPFLWLLLKQKFNLETSDR